MTKPSNACPFWTDVGCGGDACALCWDLVESIRRLQPAVRPRVYTQRARKSKGAKGI